MGKKQGKGSIAMEMWEIFRQEAQRAGFSAFGVCPFAPFADRLLLCRAAARTPAGAKSVLSVLFPYRSAGMEEAGRNLSRYACVEDYHMAGGRVLQELAGAMARRIPERAFVPFLDNSPIPEVEAAARCGLGVVGKNGLLLHPRYGSWVFIGEIVTDADFMEAGEEPRGCPDCGACAAACPGKCLPGGDRTGCLSALTQKKGALTEQEEEAVRRGGLIWGCDACQEVCPLNRRAVCEPHPCFSSPSTRLTEEGLVNLHGKAYGWRGAEVLRRNLRIFSEKKETGK